MWLPSNIIYFTVYDIHLMENTCSTRGWHYSQGEDSAVHLGQTGGWNLKHRNFSGTRQRNNCHTPLRGDTARDGLANLKILLSGILWFPLSHTKLRYLKGTESLPRSSFPRQEGMDQHWHRMTKQPSQDGPDSPSPSRGTVKLPKLTNSICYWERRFQQNTWFPHHNSPCRVMGGSWR